MKNIVVFSGAGMSAESGLKTFRGNGGLWEGHRIEDVATPEAWSKNPARVLDFYNQRRIQVRTAQPNSAHKALVKLEDFYSVHIITQNVDDLHERAGSKKVLHLHGEILYARSTTNPEHVQHLGSRNISIGDTCPLGSQLRPHIVWFGEQVPFFDKAVSIVSEADVFICIGTSLQVFPASSLVQFTPQHTQQIVINPECQELKGMHGAEHLEMTACDGVPFLVKRLLEEMVDQDDS